MNKELIVSHTSAIEPVIDVAALVKRTKLIHQVMKEVMEKDVHYGIIPGCQKPSLFQPGAQVLRQVFGLSATFEVITNQLPNNHREYIVAATIRNQSGAIVGEGRGSCSTLEKKFRYRDGQRKCPMCSKPTIIKGKAEYGGGWLCFAKKGGCGAKFSDDAPEIIGQPLGQIENPDIADMYNTCLKMAVKRADVGGTISVTGASALFTQDVEDLPDYGEPTKPQSSRNQEPDDFDVPTDLSTPQDRPLTAHFYDINKAPEAKRDAVKAFLRKQGAQQVDGNGIWASEVEIVKCKPFEVQL